MSNSSDKLAMLLELARQIAIKQNVSVANIKLTWKEASNGEFLPEVEVVNLKIGK